MPNAPDPSAKPRSAGAIPRRRVPQAWPKDRRFRILAIDGGGIRGIFPASVLAGLEHRYTGGRPIGAYFDLVAGTSTGGILALGLGAGYSGRELAELYIERGGEVFPPRREGLRGRVAAVLGAAWQFARYRYDRDALQRLLQDQLGDRLLGESTLRLAIPAFEGRHSEVFVFKTPHHPDYHLDRRERMVTVGLATAAAPTYFRALDHGGYTLVDGGVWANNPVMLGVIEALTCFDVDRDQIDVLSIGCGDDPFHVKSAWRKAGGFIQWREIIFAAMRLQSLAATNQARLLLGPSAVHRIDAPTNESKLKLDDWARAKTELPPAAALALEQSGEAIAKVFLGNPAASYEPAASA